MSDRRDDKLETLLRNRRTEAASPDLAERIILMARGVPQEKSVTFWQAMRELCAEFHLPRPAYMLATALIIGIVLGLSVPQDPTTGGDDDSFVVQGFLSGDEAPL